MTAAEVLFSLIENAEARLQGAQARAAQNPAYASDVIAYELAVLELRRALADVQSLDRG